MATLQSVIDGLNKEGYRCKRTSTVDQIIVSDKDSAQKQIVNITTPLTEEQYISAVKQIIFSFSQ